MITTIITIKTNIMINGKVLYCLMPKDYSIARLLKSSWRYALEDSLMEAWLKLEKDIFSVTRAISCDNEDINRWQGNWYNINFTNESDNVTINKDFFLELLSIYGSLTHSQLMDLDANLSDSSISNLSDIYEVINKIDAGLM